MPEIKMSDFSAAVKEFLKDYSEEVKQAVTVAVTEVADESASELKHAGSFNGTKYRKSWSSRVEQTKLGAKGVVFNKKYYRLSHLLEFGHALKGGGRTRAFVHIAPVNDKTGDRFIQKLEEVLGK